MIYVASIVFCFYKVRSKFIKSNIEIVERRGCNVIKLSLFYDISTKEKSHDESK